MKNTKIVYLLLLWLSIASCKEKVNNHDASGSFEATETIISAEANGKILQLNIDEGQQLDSGQLVGFIDSTQLATQQSATYAKQKSHTQRQARGKRAGRDFENRTSKCNT